MEIYSVEDKIGVKSDFDVLSFERKIVELVEELRLRMNLEIESEKGLKACMEEKYILETKLDEQQRRHICEKQSFEQQISFLRRKLEDNVCVSDDEKAKQQIVNKTYSQEIRALKEDLRNAGCEKLTLIKRIQALEAQLKLHNNYQESIMKQIVEIRNRSKSLIEECEELRNAQKTVMENVTEAKISFLRFNQSNDHLLKSIAIIEKKNEALKKDLVSCRSDLIISKNSINPSTKTKICDSDLEKLQNRNLDLEKLLLQSRKENEKTLSNLVESNKRLCGYMNKYADAQKNAKSMSSKTENYENEIAVLKKNLKKLKEDLQKLKEKEVLQQKDSENNQMMATASAKFAEISTEAKQLPEVLFTPTGNKDKDVMKQWQKLSVFPLPGGKNETSEFKMLEETLTFRQIVKRKRSFMEEQKDGDCTLPLKKPYTENITNANQSNCVATFQMEEDRSLPSSLNSSQNSISCSQNSANKSEESNQIKIKSGISNETEMKELISVEKNLKNLQVFDKEPPVSFDSKETSSES